MQLVVTCESDGGCHGRGAVRGRAVSPGWHPERSVLYRGAVGVPVVITLGMLFSLLVLGASMFDGALVLFEWVAYLGLLVLVGAYRWRQLVRGRA